MIYFSKYNSKIGQLNIYVENNYLIGLELNTDNSNFNNLKTFEKNDHVLILKVKKWLNNYFTMKSTDSINIPIKFNNTEFQIKIYNYLLNVPFGKTITYKDIAQNCFTNNMSYQAVGSAVGKNPILLIVPCHRVIGSNNKLGGFSSGIDNKIKLLLHERINTTNLI